MKPCPKCMNLHDKPGLFCSRRCANSRIKSIEDRKNVSNSLKAFYSTPNGIKNREEKRERGLTFIHSVERNKKISEKWKDEEYRISIISKLTGRVIKEETRKKLSELAKKNEFGGHTSKKTLLFKKANGEEVFLQSSYEIRFAQILEEMKIDWERPKPFIWTDLYGKTHRYYPDFKIGDKYFDTKNDYLAVVDSEKLDAVRLQNGINLVVITENQINRDFIAGLV